MQRSQLRAPPNGSFSLSGLTKRSLSVNLRKRIQRAVKFLDFFHVRFDQLDRRNFLLADLLSHLNGWQKSEIVHALAYPGEMASLACAIPTQQSTSRSRSLGGELQAAGSCRTSYARDHSRLRIPFYEPLF